MSQARALNERELPGEASCSDDAFKERERHWLGTYRSPLYADELVPGAASVREPYPGCPKCVDERGALDPLCNACRVRILFVRLPGTPIRYALRTLPAWRQLSGL